VNKAKTSHNPTKRGHTVTIAVPAKIAITPIANIMAIVISEKRMSLKAAFLALPECFM
jgi:hypothetical protein